MRTHTGGCHCGRVRFELTTDLAQARVSECNCSICRRKGYLHHIVPRDRFRLVAGADDLTSYRFGTMTAQHHFCRHCGVASFYVPRSHPDGIDVNVRCLDDVDLGTLQIEQFDGRNWEASIGKLEV
ncbi:MAG TPA: GFA family protein [Candidatus Binatia bacterium]|nr:GFA family protein [Candidatus Binatia bacterium]